MKFDDLISTIDQLDDEQIDEVVDWQMSQSPAARREHQRGYGIGLLPPSAATLENPFQRMIDSIQNMLDVLLPWPDIRMSLWLPGDDAPAAQYLADRCTQCQRYMPISARPDPELSRPGVLFCDECAGMQR